MNATVTLNFFSSSQRIGLIILAVLASVMIILLISLVEMVVLQLLHWGNTHQSLKASVAINLVSSLVGLLLLLRFPQPELLHLGVAWFLMVVIEGAILNHIRAGTPAYSWFVAAVANLASYIILILPALLSRG